MGTSFEGMGRVCAELTTAVNSTCRLRCPKCERLPGYKSKVPVLTSSNCRVRASSKHGRDRTRSARRKKFKSMCFPRNGLPVDLTLGPEAGMTRPSAGAVRLIPGRRNQAQVHPLVRSDLRCSHPDGRHSRGGQHRARRLGVKVGPRGFTHSTLSLDVI